MMTPENNHQPGVVESMHGLGVNHDASCERSYLSDDTVYTDVEQLRLAWHQFQRGSLEHNRRRAVMRCYISPELINQISDLPVEAMVSLEKECLLWLGQNQHSTFSAERNTNDLPGQAAIDLAPTYQLDREAQTKDVADLILLWEQFGWTEQGIETFLESNSQPIVLIRHLEQQVVGAMIAEAMEFGCWQLVELTELAVTPEHRGQGLASILVKELSRLSVDYYGLRSLIFGEYNLTTHSYRAAARSDQRPGRNLDCGVDGVLRDHVTIETGPGNKEHSAWQARWLHHFLVMYQLGNEVK